MFQPLLKVNIRNSYYVKSIGYDYNYNVLNKILIKQDGQVKGQKGAHWVSYVTLRMEKISFKH